MWVSNGKRDLKEEEKPVLVVVLSDHNHFIEADKALEKNPVRISAKQKQSNKSNSFIIKAKNCLNLLKAYLQVKK